MLSPESEEEVQSTEEQEYFYNPNNNQKQQHNNEDDKRREARHDSDDEDEEENNKQLINRYFNERNVNNQLQQLDSNHHNNNASSSSSAPPRRRRWDSKVKVSNNSEENKEDEEEGTIIQEKKHKRYDEFEERPKKQMKSAWDEQGEDEVDDDINSFTTTTKSSTTTRSSGGLSPLSFTTSDASDDDFRSSFEESYRRGDKWNRQTTSSSSSSSSQMMPGDATPKYVGKWDQIDKTPVITAGGSSSAATPLMLHTPRNGSSSSSVRGNVISTPLGSMTPQEYTQRKIEQDIEARNRYLSDEELDAMLPTEGYEVLKPPENYIPKRKNKAVTGEGSSSVSATPLQGSATPYYTIPEEGIMSAYGIPLNTTLGPDMPDLKPDDIQYFGKILEEKDEKEMDDEEILERKILRLLLKIKNGNPQMRKQAMKYITEHARELGAGPLLNNILPVMMSPTLEEQERHLLVKLIDRILYKLDDLVRPYVHKILLVTQPMLIEEDYYTRVEGREIIANLAKAAGLHTMIAAMRPDIDHSEEYMRNTTSRAFAVVASALGIQNIIPFLKAVCKHKKTWEARHTGIRIVQQIAALVGCGILPYLTDLVEIIKDGFYDKEARVRTMTGLAIAALAQSAAPYGIESFDCVLKPLWKGLEISKGKMLAAYIKAIGYIIPLMDAEQAKKYTTAVIDHIVRQFSSQEEEMRRIVLKAIAQCVSTEGIDAQFVKEHIIPTFFTSFWDRSMAQERRNYNQLVETTVALANNVGASLVVGELVNNLKDDSEPFRHMVLETIMKILQSLGTSDINERLEEELIDGCLYCFISDQTNPNDKKQYYLVIEGFAAILNAFGIRSKKTIPKITGQIRHRFSHKSERVRQQASDLLAEIVPIMKTCGEEHRLTHFGMALYEQLTVEEYPEVLGSVLLAMNAIVDALEPEVMNPPIGDILTRCTPILKNRNEKVEENLIKLIGTIASKAPDKVSSKEWLRICFDLLEILRAHKKSIRRAATKTFGYIAKCIGPSDVLVTLLSNLRVQERQNRVCTTVAIAIVSEICGPFTVLPALMNEYRVPELNVQNGVLKSLSFLFEYIGELSKDYVYAVTPLLEDALMDRDLVHRQTACSAIKHLALGIYGQGKEDILVHLLNFVWPNIFETPPHVINAVMEALEALRVALGPGIILQYLLQGLFSPARKVRDAYWKVYNNVYIGNQEAMIPFYPRLTDEVSTSPSNTNSNSNNNSNNSSDVVDKNTNHSNTTSENTGNEEDESTNNNNNPTEIPLYMNHYTRTELDWFI